MAPKIGKKAWENPPSKIIENFLLLFVRIAAYFATFQFFCKKQKYLWRVSEFLQSIRDGY